MQEITGDLFESVNAEAICITTNGFVSPQGANTMGRGCAGRAKFLWPGIQLILGQHIREGGNHVHHLTHTQSKLPPVVMLSFRLCKEWPHKWEPFHQVPYQIFSFPTKNHWSEDSDLNLIERSAQELLVQMDQTGYDEVVVPRPGCGLGRLSWEDQVRPLLSKLWDDRFYVIHHQE